MQSRTPTRQRLISAAARRFQRQGMAATGLNDVLADAGAPRGSLYHHFPGGKNELAAAAIRHSGAEIAAAIDGALSASPDVPSAIRAFAAFYEARLAASDFRDGCPIATTALEAAALDAPAVEQACDDAIAAWESLLAARLAAAGHRPERARGLATFIVAALEGALLLAKVRRSAEPLRSTAACLEEALSPR